jgi:CDP-diacylglycerol--glycerol-3-phosphate 3-phosphatidyltransferase/cardiolipin synthase
VSRLAKWKTTLQLVSLGALILGAPCRMGPCGCSGSRPTCPHTVGADDVVGAAAVLTVVTGWDYLRVGLRHMD